LLAGAASGCSSDVTRFDGIFSSKPDRLTTNSIPHRVNEVNGRLPTPRENVTAAGDDDQSSDVALNQPLPQRRGVDYDQISTSTTESAARASVKPVRIERAELTAPSVKVRTEEKVALAQPFPAKRLLANEVNADPINTGTIKQAWRVSDASPRIMIKSGDTLSAISVRYHVPQAEILRANKIATGADLKFGRSIVIPVSVKVEMKMKAVPVELAVDTKSKKKIPVPSKVPEQEQAILPTANSRDKAKNADTKLAANNKNDASDGVYVVKEGDSLARIAKMHKVTIDQLKTANNMSVASIRIGQKLSIPDGDTVTASIPTRKKEVKETAEANKPKTYTPPVAEKSVEDVQKTADNGEKAPDETGIGKYRWPVRGAVIAGYGQNIDGVRNAGIDISVPEGTPIKSAENGVVIYAGSGLKDLGNTVLVRHDDGTVTVYGNAANLGVKRGDKVTRGEVIANSGMTGGAKRPKVHFEVRQNAVAVNPMTFLQ
jgi:murein DD-endopeptidase MepM/ murein hydrolase activator NlpD